MTKILKKHPCGCLSAFSLTASELAQAGTGRLRNDRIVTLQKKSYNKNVDKRNLMSRILEKGK
jgi:hypothetical protein